MNIKLAIEDAHDWLQDHPLISIPAFALSAWFVVIITTALVISAPSKPPEPITAQDIAASIDLLTVRTLTVQDAIKRHEQVIEEYRSGNMSSDDIAASLTELDAAWKEYDRRVVDATMMYLR